MTHPIAIGLMAIVLLMGLAVGFSLHTVRDYEDPGQSGSSFIEGRGAIGERMGFVTSVEASDGRIFIGFDEAQMYTGEAAQNAALIAGRCTPETLEECTPNDYFIENTTRDISWIPLSPQARITMETLSHTEAGMYQSGEVIAISRFQSLWSGSSASLWQQLPFWITVENGVVTAIREQYIP